MKIKFRGLFIGLALFASITSIHAGVAFTNLVFFTYTNPPDYGWNFDSESPHLCALAQGNDGNFYGTTWTGGNNENGNYAYATTGNGTVFKMTPNGAFTSLYSFGSLFANNMELDGSHPAGNLIQGADGNLYGTTYYGGTIPGVTAGTIFEITTNGTLGGLYSFGHNPGDNTNVDIDTGTNTDGESPEAGLVQGSDGNFYGTTSEYGPGGGGTVFQFIPGVGLNTLYSFHPPTMLTGILTVICPGRSWWRVQMVISTARPIGAGRMTSAQYLE